MSNEEKIIELTKRIEVLEAAENKRIRKRKIKLAYEITKIVLLLCILLAGYIYLNVKVIKPYKDTVNTFNEKIDIVQEFFNNQTDKVKSWFN